VGCGQGDKGMGLVPSAQSLPNPRKSALDQGKRKFYRFRQATPVWKLRPSNGMGIEEPTDGEPSLNYHSSTDRSVRVVDPVFD
jgi:hypothetical protein